MHIPDGLIPLNQVLVYLILAIVILAVALWQSNKRLSSKQIPTVGVLAAGLFAAQMFNFPVPFGSSGHLIGTALATTLVGPWVSMIIISSILIVQAMFGDGGLLAFGVNSINMAILGSLITFAIYLILPKKWKENKEKVAIFAGIAGFTSTIVMALFAAIELYLAGIGSAATIFGWMLGLHAIIGLIEGVITGAIVFFLFRAEPSMFITSQKALSLTKHEITAKPQFHFPKWAGLTTLAVFLIMTVFGFIVPYVGGDNPDGLERTFEILEEQGVNLNIGEGGLFGFPEGLGWDILQMSIVMIILFSLFLLLSYVRYLLNLLRYEKKNKPLSEDLINETVL